MPYQQLEKEAKEIWHAKRKWLNNISVFLSWRREICWRGSRGWFKKEETNFLLCAQVVSVLHSVEISLKSLYLFSFPIEPVTWTLSWCNVRLLFSNCDPGPFKQERFLNSKNSWLFLRASTTYGIMYIAIQITAEISIWTRSPKVPTVINKLLTLFEMCATNDDRCKASLAPFYGILGSVFYDAIDLAVGSVFKLFFFGG